MTGRNQHGSLIDLDVSLTPVQEAGPRLRWQKERLVSLVANDDNAAAIALSRKSNLLCPFTAFVAWDAAEKVAVASHRLVQPALIPDYAAGGDHAVEGIPSISCPSTAPQRTRFAFISRKHFAASRCVSPTDQSHQPASRDDETDLVQKRIDVLIPAFRHATRMDDVAALLLTIRDWLRQNPGAISLVAQLLEECARDLTEWTDGEQRLHTFSSHIVDKLEEAVSALRQVSSTLRTQAEWRESLQATLSRASNAIGGAEILDTIAITAAREDQIRRRVTDFSLMYLQLPASKSPSKNNPPDRRGEYS